MALRPSNEKQQEQERTREALLRAALRLGAEHGFASLGLRAVAREAEIAPTSFYRHFQHMEALGLGLMRDKVEPFLRAWVNSLPSAAQVPEALVAAVFLTVGQDPELTRFIVAERVGSSSVLRAELRQALHELSAPLLAALQSGPRAADSVDIADMIITGLIEFAAQLLDTPVSGHPALRQRILIFIQLIANSVHSGNTHHE